MGSSRISGKGRTNLEEKVSLISVAIGDPLDGHYLAKPRHALCRPETDPGIGLQPVQGFLPCLRCQQGSLRTASVHSLGMPPGRARPSGPCRHQRSVDPGSPVGPNRGRPLQGAASRCVSWNDLGANPAGRSRPEHGAPSPLARIVPPPRRDALSICPNGQ